MLRRLIVVLLAMTGAAAGCAKAHQPAPGDTPGSRSVGDLLAFEITPPPQWSPAPMSAQVKHEVQWAYTPEPQNKMATRPDVYVMNGGGMRSDLDGFAEVRQEYLDRDKTATIVEPRSAALLGGKPAQRFHFVKTAVDGSRQENVELMAKHGTILYCVGFKAPPDRFAQLWPAAKQSIDSFRWLENR